MSAPLELVAAFAARASGAARESLAGWAEGRVRYTAARQSAGGQVIPPSMFPPRSAGLAASQAAVAYYLALNGD